MWLGRMENLITNAVEETAGDKGMTISLQQSLLWLLPLGLSCVPPLPLHFAPSWK